MTELQLPCSSAALPVSGCAGKMAAPTQRRASSSCEIPGGFTGVYGFRFEMRTQKSCRGTSRVSVPSGKSNRKREGLTPRALHTPAIKKNININHPGGSGTQESAVFIVSSSTDGALMFLQTASCLKSPQARKTSGAE